MGLRFCNEAVMCLTQIYPRISDTHEKEELTPLQVIKGCKERLDNSFPLHFCSFPFSPLLKVLDIEKAFCRELNIDFLPSFPVHQQSHTNF